MTTIRRNTEPPRRLIGTVTVETPGHPLYGSSFLVCPACGGQYLHQGTVVVYDRNDGDEETLVTEVADGGLISSHYRPSEQVANPSSFRQGLTIDFTCEGCAFEPQLRIAQHKGQTLLSWACTDPFEELSQYQIYRPPPKLEG